MIILILSLRNYHGATDGTYLVLLTSILFQIFLLLVFTPELELELLVLLLNFGNQHLLSLNDAVGDAFGTLLL